MTSEPGLWRGQSTKTDHGVALSCCFPGHWLLPRVAAGTQVVVSFRAQPQAEESVGVGTVRSHVPCSGVTDKAVLRAPRCSVRETYLFI